MIEGEGQVAGRLEVLVEASTKGFRRDLERKVNEAAKGIEAKIGVKINAKALRKELQAKVDEASAGVKAKIGVELDDASVAELKAKLDAVAKTAGTKVKVEADGDLAGEVARKAEEAQAAADTKPVKVGLRAHVGQLLRDVLLARQEAQAEADAEPVKIKVKADTKGLGLSGHTLMRVGLYSGIASMIEPLVGGIGQIVGGLTAMAGAAGPAVGTVEALPAAIGAGVQGMLGLKLATSGVGQAMGLLSRQQMAVANGTKLSTLQQQQLKRSLNELAPSAVRFVKDLTGMRSKWVGLRKDLQEPLFKALDQELKPLAAKTLPTLDKGLTQTDTVIGRLITKTGRWMSSPLFNHQFAGAMQQNNRTLAAGGSALLDFAKGMTWFYRASAPFQARMDKYVQGTGQWFLGMAKGNAQNGDTARFLDKATNRLTMLWHITKEFGGGLRGIFRAGDASGMRLLHTFDQFLTNWRSWVDSTQGQTYLSKWFANTEDGFKEISRLVDDTFKGIAHWAADPKIEGMIRQLRTKFGPALSQFLQALSKNMGGNVIDLLTQLTRLLNNAEPAIEMMSTLTKGLLALANGLNTAMEAMPGFTHQFMSVLGAVLLMRSGKGLLGKIGLGGLLGRGAARGAAAGAEGAAGGGLLEALGLGALAGGGGAKIASRARVLRRLKALRRLRRMGGLAGEGAGWGKYLGDAVEVGVKSPLAKKAGIVGLALTAIDLYNQGKGSFHNFSGLTDSYGNTLNRRGRANALSVRAVQQQFGQGNKLNELAPSLGFSTNALAAALARGGSGSPYVRNLMARLQKEKGSGVGGYFKGLGNTLSFGKLGGNANKAAEALKDLKKITKAIDDARSAAKGNGKSLGEMLFGPLADGINKGAQAAQKAVEKLDHQIRGLPKAVQTQIKTPGLVKNIQDVKILADQYKLTPKQVVTALSASGVVKTLHDVEHAQRVFHLTPKQITTLVRTSGMKPTLADVAKLHWQYKLTPKQVVTLLKATGKDFSLGQVLALQKQYHLTPRQVTTLLRANISQAAGEAWKLRSIYAGIPRYIKTQAVTEHIDKFSRMTRRAFGGFVSGPGGPTSDSIPARLSNGEFVVRAASVKKYGLHMLDRINAGRFANGGLVGRFAKGGHVTKHWLNGDFMWALQQGVGNIMEEQRRLTAKIGRRKERAFNHRFRQQEKQAKARAAIADRLDRATQRLADLTNFKNTMTTGLRDSARSYGSVSAIGSSWGGYLSPTALIGELRRRAASASGFRGNMATLRRKGLSRLAYEQLAAAGFESGGPLAEQLAKASASQIQTINHLQSSIVSSAARLGKDGMKGYYNAGIDAANGLVHGLESRQGSLNKAAKKMAGALVKAIKHRLRIHSPSRVMAEIGGNTVDGISVGMNARRSRLMAHANGIAAQLAAELTPGSTYANSHMATLTSAGRHSASGLAHYLPQLAPLVGELVIQGKSDEEIKNALEEAMFALRQIRQGGVHADRVA